MKQVWSFKELVGLWKIWGSSLIFPGLCLTQQESAVEVDLEPQPRHACRVVVLVCSRP